MPCVLSSRLQAELCNVLRSSCGACDTVPMGRQRLPAAALIGAAPGAAAAACCRQQQREQHWEVKSERCGRRSVGSNLQLGRQYHDCILRCYSRSIAQRDSRQLLHPAQSSLAAYLAQQERSALIECHGIGNSAGGSSLVAWAAAAAAAVAAADVAIALSRNGWTGQLSGTHADHRCCVCCSTT